MKGPVRTVLLAVALLAAGIFTGVWAVLWSIRGSYLTALIMLGVTTWAIGFAVYYLHTTTLGLARPRTESGSTGTRLRPSQFVNGVFFVAYSGMLLAAGLFLTFYPLGMVDYVPSGVMRRSIPAGCGFVLAFGIPTLIRSVKYGGSARLHLDPGGIDVWDAQWSTQRRANWSEVEQILDHRPKGKKPFNQVIGLALAKGRGVVLKSDDITGDSAKLREWVRFYWTHPESRDELVDGRGLQRLSTGDFSSG